MSDIESKELLPDNLLEEVLIFRLKAMREDKELSYKIQQNLIGISDIALAQKKLILEEQSVQNQNDFAIKFNEIISNISVNPFGANVLGSSNKNIEDPRLPLFEFAPGENEKGIIEVPYDIIKD